MVAAIVGEEYAKQDTAIGKELDALEEFVKDNPDDFLLKACLDAADQQKAAFDKRKK